jgi:protocatechuate 3,4-dioxygenase beta subunit
MTRVKGRSEVAKGEKIRLRGRVVDSRTGAAISGAMVEFWQACASGRYNHPKDPNTAPLDPHFQYWAQVRSDEEGQFALLTIKPGAYPADDSWIRPPHIHVKVHKEGYPSLTTQLYFAGESLNESDQILQRLGPEQRSLVTVDFDQTGAEGEVVGEWTIFISRFVGLVDPHGQSHVQLTPEIA